MNATLALVLSRSSLCHWQPETQGSFGIGNAFEFGGWQRLFGEPWITPFPDGALLCPKPGFDVSTLPADRAPLPCLWW